MSGWERHDLKGETPTQEEIDRAELASRMASARYDAGLPPAPDPEPEQRVIMTREQLLDMVESAKADGRREVTGGWPMSVILIGVGFVVGLLVGLWF